MSETKILVLKRSHIFLVCAGLLLLLILILFLRAFFTGEKKEEPSTPTYTAGVYEKELTIGSYPVTLTVTATSTHITGATLSFREEAVETMYPLLGNAMLHINEQLALGTSPEAIVPEAESRYTEAFLLEAILTAVPPATTPTP